MDIANQISRSAQAAVKALYGQDVPEKMIQLQKTKREFEGHLTLVVFPLLKTSRKKPEDTAEDMRRWLVENEPAVASYNVVKGFLNLVVSPQAWLSLLADINAGVAVAARRHQRRRALRRGEGRGRRSAGDD